MSDEEEQALERARDNLARLRREMSKRIVGHERLVRGILTCLVAAGHALLEGVPGLGKTLIVKTLGEAVDLRFSRIQFTPDLMPADIIGTQILVDDEGGHRHLRFQPGPVFTQLLLADEINRATPKTQSALLEAMEESTVTVGGERHPLGPPFMVLATQNPLEMEGTYPLPEAQLDRFALKLHAEYPSAEELLKIADGSTGPAPAAVAAVISAAELLEARELARRVVVASHVKEYAVRLILATHPGDAGSTQATQRFVRHGASPRGLLAMLLAAKAAALMDGRLNVSFDDLREAAAPALRHRILLNFEAEAEGVSPDTLIDELLEHVPVHG